MALRALDPRSGLPTTDEEDRIVADIADALRRLPSVEIVRDGQVPFLAAGD